MRISVTLCAVFVSLVIMSTGPDCLLGQANGNLFWWYQGIENVESVASIEDQDGDGWPEAVVMTYDAGAPQMDDLLLIKGNSSGYGDLIWSTKPYGGVSGGGGYGDQCLSTISDLSGNGLSDILLGTAWGGRTAFAITGVSGDIMFQYDTYVHPPDGWCYSVNPIEDLNNDGLDEVLASFGNYTQAAFCLDGASEGDATVIWKWSANGDGVLSICSPGDVNGDGYADALAGCGGNFIDQRVVMIDGSSIGSPATLLWQYETGSGLQDVSPIEDVNGSGTVDALAGGWDYNVYCIEGGSTGTGVVIWQTNLGTGNVIMRVESIPDVNSDGTDDVLVGSWDNAIICLDGASGAFIWNTPTGSLNGGDVWTIYPIPDVDGDGIWDVVAGSFDTKIYVASGATGTVLWTYTTGSRLYTVRSIPDVNGDGIADVISGTQMLSGNGGKIYCIEGDSHGPWMDITVDPDTTVIYAGNRIGAEVGLANTTGNPQTVDVWVSVRTPWGPEVPIIQVFDLTLPGNTSISPHLTKKIPGKTPSGTYTFFATVGDYGTTVVDRDSFDLEVIRPMEAMARTQTVHSESGLSRQEITELWGSQSCVLEIPETANTVCRSDRETFVPRLERSEPSVSTERYLNWAIDTIGNNTDLILSARRMGLGPIE